MELSHAHSENGRELAAVSRPKKKWRVLTMLKGHSTLRKTQGCALVSRRDVGLRSGGGGNVWVGLDGGGHGWVWADERASELQQRAGWEVEVEDGSAQERMGYRWRSKR